MPYDEFTAERVRPLVARRRGFSEKKMFGGVGYFVNGNMCCGVWKEYLILRVGPDAYEDALSQPFANEFDITGRAMKGWIMVEPEGFEEDEELDAWVQLALTYVRRLPPKNAG